MMYLIWQPVTILILCLLVEFAKDLPGAFARFIWENIYLRLDLVL